MKYNDLTVEKNTRPSRKGRGISAGQGKTAGRGTKGQKARAGRGIRAGFEGGQLPLQRRLPKVGFNNSVFATNYAIINVCDLEERFEANSVVDEAAVVACGLVKKVNDGIKVLGRGEITKPLTVELKAFSASAKEKIEAAGGKAEVK